MIDARQKVARARIVFSRLDSDGALPHGGKKFFRAHDPRGALGKAEALQPGERQDRSIDFAVVELA